MSKVKVKSQDSKVNDYTTLQLMDNLIAETQKFSEDLAALFPERLTKIHSSFTAVMLAHYWGSEGIEEATSQSRITRIKKGEYNLSNPKNLNGLNDLEAGLVRELGTVNSKECKELIEDYKRNKLSGLDFVNKLFLEMGRISGDIKLNVEEAGVILGGVDHFVKYLRAKISNPNDSGYNPNYKFSLEQLEFMERNANFYFGEKVKNCLEEIQKYKLANPDLKEYSLQQYNVKNAHFFQNLDSVEKLYWFGFLMHDGFLTNPKSYRIGLELSRMDRDHLSRFAMAIGLDLNENDIKDYVKKQLYKGEVKEYPMSAIYIGCKPMFDEIKEQGIIGLKSERKEVPHVVKNLLSIAKNNASQDNVDWKDTKHGKMALAWLYGMYDADGSWDPREHYFGYLFSSIEDYLWEIKGLFEIKNDVVEEVSPGTVRKAFDREFISKGFYHLCVNSDCFKKMIRIYSGGLNRKNPDKNPRKCSP